MVKHKLEFINIQNYKNVVLKYIVFSIFVISVCSCIIYFIFEGILYSDYKNLKDTIDNFILEGKSELTIYRFDKYKVNDEIKPILDNQKSGSIFFQDPSTAARTDKNNIRTSSTMGGAFTIWSLKKTDPARDEYEYVEITAGAVGYTTPPIYGEQTPLELYQNALEYYLDKDYHNSRQGNGYPLTQVKPKSVAPSIKDMFFSSKHYSLRDRFEYLPSGQWGSGQSGISRYGNDYRTVYMNYSNRLLKIDEVDHELEDYRTTTLCLIIPLLMVLMTILFKFNKKRIQCIDLYWKKWYCEESETAIVFEYNILTKNSMMLITSESEIAGSFCLSNSKLIKFQNSLNNTSIYEIIEIDASRLILKDSSTNTISNYVSI